MSETKFKQLTVDNVFDFCAVLDVIGMDTITNIFNTEEISVMIKTAEITQKKGKKDKQSEDPFHGVGVVMAMKIAGLLVKNLSRARHEIYQFFANTLVWENGKDVTPDELSKFTPGKFLQIIKDFAKLDDLADFFKEVAGFMAMTNPDSQPDSVN